MTRQEHFHFGAERFQRFQLRAYEKLSVTVPTHVQGNDTDVVTGDEVNIVFHIVERKGKNAVEFFDEVNALVLIQSQNDFAIGHGLKFVFVLVAFANLQVIVDFTINCKNTGSVR